MQASLVRVPLIRERYLPDADIVIATAWPTAYDVARLSPAKGKPVYFIMHYEVDSGPAALVEGTYSLPMYRLTIAELTRHLLQEKFNCPVAEVVPCGVDPRVFFADGEAEPMTVLMFYSPDPRKGAADGLKALERLKDRLPGLRARLFGGHVPSALPKWITFYARPTDSELRRLYASSTALLYSSHYEGFGLPPLEAMACGCPVVSTRVGAVPDFTADGHDAVLVDVGDIKAMANGLEQLLTNREFRDVLVQRSLKRAQDYTTDRMAARFATALLRAAGTGAG